MSSVQKARIRKTKVFLKRPTSFAKLLVKDLETLVARQKRDGVRQVIRLNGTSDIAWEKFQVTRAGREYSGVPQAFPELQFYDYTKRPERAIKFVTSIAWPSNYSLTFSQATPKDRTADRVNLTGELNIAVVFRNALPEYYKGRRVIDGTEHDMRFLDPAGVIVGLLAKGAAKRDNSGFVVDV